MKRWILVVCLLLAALTPAVAQPADIREGLVLQSQVLKKAGRYSIYLPAGYETTRRSYPVLYLLHGYGDDDTAWIHFGELAQILDDAIARREATPMIVVMPDAGVSWYMNSFDGSLKWEDYFIKEFIPYIESRFRVHPSRSSRAIAGLSMGGYGALLQSLHHPDLFGSCAALSSAVRTDAQIQALTEQEWQRRAQAWGPDPKGTARLTPHLEANNPLKLMAAGDVEKLKSIRWYLDCGDEDHLLPGNLALYQIMRDRDIPLSLRVRGGGHVWSYWRSGLPAVLSFVTAGFRQN